MIASSIYKTNSNILKTLHILKSEGGQPKDPLRAEVTHPPSHAGTYAADTRATSVKPRLLRAKKKV